MMIRCVGLDIGYKDRIGKGLVGPDAPKFENPLLRNGQRYSVLPDIICEMGRLGQKTGRVIALMPARFRTAFQ